MKKNLITIIDGLADHLEQCAARMETFKMGSVVLVDDDGNLVGIVSRTDITKAFSTVYGGKYLVKDFMTKKVVTCRKSDSLKFALSTMNSNGVSRLVVTDEQGSPLGLITTNTFLTHSDYFSMGNTTSRDYLLPQKGDKLTVGDVISYEVLSVDQDEDLAAAAALMSKNKVSGLPVIDKKKKLVGVISKSDVVRAFSVVHPHEKLRAKYEEVY